MNDLPDNCSAFDELVAEAWRDHPEANAARDRMGKASYCRPQSRPAVEQAGGVMAKPYKVVVDVPGCKHCHAGKMWSVMDSEDCLLGMSWSSRSDAVEVAALMNQAYAEGHKVAKSKPEGA